MIMTPSRIEQTLEVWICNFWRFISSRWLYDPASQEDCLSNQYKTEILDEFSYIIWLTWSGKNSITEHFKKISQREKPFNFKKINLLLEY